jgi:hypothetical protein
MDSCMLFCLEKLHSLLVAGCQYHDSKEYLEAGLLVLDVIALWLDRNQSELIKIKAKLSHLEKKSHEL